MVTFVLYLFFLFFFFFKQKTAYEMRISDWSSDVCSSDLLTFYADVMGLLGGAVMATVVLDISFFQFARQLNDAVTPWTFWIGIIKAPLFAFIIGMIGCYEGLQVSRSAESVGRQTTRAVVEIGRAHV